MEERDLERLIVDNAAFEAIDAAMNVFCPFDSVGMSRQEVKHGRFLEYILDPARPHGFGAECLRAFMRAVAGTLSGEGVGIAPLDVHLMELDGANVRREYESIDLLIEVPQERLIVAIELKIDASEHSGQLGRYRRIVEREWPTHKRLLIFLTKRGEAPSADGAGWYPLGLAPVIDSLAGVATRGAGQPAARMMLDAYVAMLRRDHVTDDRLEQLAGGLWREHREALEFLMERRPDVKYALLGALGDRQSEVAKRLSANTELNIEGAYSTKSVTRFAVTDWESYPGMLSGSSQWSPSKHMLLLEVRSSAGANKIQFTLGSGETRQQLFDALREVGAAVGFGQELGTYKSRQLANVSFKADETMTAEETFDKLVDAIAAFINEHAASYDKAMTLLASMAGSPMPAG